MKSRFGMRLSILAAVALASGIASLAIARAVDLPENAPIPESRDADQALPESGKAEPVPESRDENQPLPDTGDAVPVPEPRPQHETEPPKMAPESETEPPPEPGSEHRKPKKSSDDRACRKSLEALGAEFTEEEPISEGFCAVDHPITITALTERIAIEPPALLNCGTALTAARVMKNKASPAALEELGSPVVSVHQVSGYVCRVRAGTETVSEHAYGNALDIGGFELADGREIAVRKYGPGHRDDAAFLSRVRHKACGPFTTVLGPGTNADHRAHFHFDLEERHRSATYCH